MTKAGVPQQTDAGRRRYLSSYPFDFDTRARILEIEIREEWEERVKESHRKSKEQVREGLSYEFGQEAIEAKTENFREIGTKPFSILSYHNALYHQVRQAYVVGGYYPALVGACALGERMLNHLMIDLRQYFTGTPEYKKVYRKDSFDKWGLAIDTLESWKILLPPVVKEFRELERLRNRSVHFNMATYSALKEDALAAVLHMREIIEQQFGAFGQHPWLIKGTRGHVFIQKSWEQHPFIKTYFVPRCPYVGPLFGMEHGPNGWLVFDRESYGDGECSDDEFATQYNNRDPKDVVVREMIESAGKGNTKTSE